MPASLALADVSLDDKYTLDDGRVFLTGTQALVRLPMLQRQRDAAAGLNTGCYITGYRGSPLGGVDQAMWRARRFVEKNNIHFQPGVNEDLAATAVWGSQQVALHPNPSVDGVFAMWYAKGPGVDRSGDVLRHGHLAGSAKHGGVLLLAGDDHTCKSSTTAHQTEYAFMDAMIPVLNPAGVQEFLDMGLYGWAMSRYSGCWIAFKTIAETVDTSASVYVGPDRSPVILPDDFEMPDGGLNIRWPDEPLDQERRLHEYKVYAALAFARANRLDKMVLDSPTPRFGIVTTGKSYLDVLQALEDLRIDAETAARIGLRVYKVGMTWPLEPHGARAFAEGLEEILVVEEKRALIENQLKEQLYNWQADKRPRVYGKFDAERNLVLPSFDELTPARIARVIANRIAAFHSSEDMRDRLAFLEAKEKQLASTPTVAKRSPYFCSGCPHNTSTRVPEGSRALAGIGCHYMAQWMDRNTATFTQMGGEGVTWLGQAPFVEEDHVFTNLGDGTYFHSGLLAIRAAIASGANITYKILYNDAVAMTGGQPHDGPLTVPQITQQVASEGASKVVVVTDEPDKYPYNAGFAKGVTVHHRDELDLIQRDLRSVRGVSVLVYDQTCAAEKRRRRKRGQFPDPAKRVMINERVCEGCGDCSIQSNCLSVVPIETEFGRKRTIDQSSCNKDYSCLNGFCPSFVTVEGGQLRKPEAAGADATSAFDNLPNPPLPSIGAQPYGVLVTGVGGTGVVTIGALIGMAAHLEGKGCSILDMAGLAQKGGPVTSHVRIAESPEAINSVRIAAGGADLVLGCDMVVASGFDALAKADAERTRAVINQSVTPTADSTLDPDYHLPMRRMRKAITEAVGDETHASFVEATRLATALLGDSLATNMFMLGYAWQKGYVPLSLESLDRAIELNGAAVTMNRQAFAWGRKAAHDPEAAERAAAPAPVAAKPDIADTLEEMVSRRIAYLTDYQNEAYARRYKDMVVHVQTVETERAKGKTGLAEAVAQYYFKLMAYKDEYEVARLFTDGEFLNKVRDTFEGDYKLAFHLAPPMLAEREGETGHMKKRRYGPWVLTAFSWLAGLKGLRGTPLDVFGYTAERRMERRLITDYEAMLGEILAGLNPENHAVAVQLAEIPEQIRGYGHVKDQHLEAAKREEKRLLELFRNPAALAQAAE